MKKIKKILFILILLIVLRGVIKYFNPSDRLELSNYNSKSIYVYNLTDDKEVLGLNENTKLPPASLTKLMTVNVALDQIDDLSNEVRIDIDSYRQLIDINSSMAGFFGNETVTFRDLLYGLILESGGECAETLAMNLGEDRTDFIENMNDKASKIGLKNTKFQNPTGLDEKNQYSTTKDIAILLKNNLMYADFRKIFTSGEYISSPTIDHPDGVMMESTVLGKLKNINLDNFTVIGGKSGTTDQAGRCWATLVAKEGKEYIVVVMGAPLDFIDGEEGQIMDTFKILNEI